MGIRPIVSSCESITERISQFVDKWLQPYMYMKNLPSYIKDTIEFINHIEATKLPTHCKLASIEHHHYIQTYHTKKESKV